MAVTTADAQRMQAQSEAPAAGLTKSKGVVHSVAEAGQKYGVDKVAGLSKMQANQKFVEAARNEIIVVSTADIKFADKKGREIKIKDMEEGWCIFKDGVYVKSTSGEVDKVPWSQRAYFNEPALNVIKEAQEAKEARLLAVGVGYYDWDGLDVGTGFGRGGVARVALLSQEATSASAPQLLRGNKEASALLSEIQTDMQAMQEKHATDMSALQKKFEKLQELVRATNE